MSIRITWLCYNTDAIFSVYRSESPMNIEDLPIPILSEISGTNTYLDLTSNIEGEYYYLVSSKYDNNVFYSGQIKTTKDIPGHFVVDIIYNYIPPYGGAVNFAMQTTL